MAASWIGLYMVTICSLEGVASRVHSFGGEGISVCAVSTSSEASITFVHFELKRSQVWFVVNCRFFYFPLKYNSNADWLLPFLFSCHPNQNPAWMRSTAFFFRRPWLHEKFQGTQVFLILFSYTADPNSVLSILRHLTLNVVVASLNRLADRVLRILFINVSLSWSVTCGDGNPS